MQMMVLPVKDTLPAALQQGHFVLPGVGHCRRMAPPDTALGAAVSPASDDIRQCGIQHFNSKRVRITKEGMKRIEPVWKRFHQMSVKTAGGLPPGAAGRPLRREPEDQRGDQKAAIRSE